MTTASVVIFAANIALVVLFGVLGYLYKSALNNLERKHHNVNSAEPSEFSGEITGTSLFLQGEARIAPPTAREEEMDAINAELEIELRKRLSQI